MYSKLLSTTRFFPLITKNYIVWIKLFIFMVIFWKFWNEFLEQCWQNLGHNCMISTSHVGQYYYLITSLVEHLHVLCLISDSEFLGALIVFCSKYSCPANEVLLVSRALVQGGDRNHNFPLFIFPFKWAVKAAAEQWHCQTCSCWGWLPKAAGAAGSAFATAAEQIFCQVFTLCLQVWSSFLEKNSWLLWPCSQGSEMREEIRIWLHI